MRIVIQRVTEAACVVYGGEQDGKRCLPHGGGEDSGAVAYRAEIGPGLVVLVGVEDADTEQDAAWLAGKVARMRLFPAAGGVGIPAYDKENVGKNAYAPSHNAISQGPKGDMEASVMEVGGAVLAVSQFTLFASTKKGNRPGWSRAARREVSEPLYEAFCRALEAELGNTVARGLFGADMKISLTNDGPVTIIMDSKNRE